MTPTFLVKSEVLYSVVAIPSMYTVPEEGINNPFINFMGATTPAWITENFPEYAIGGGFTSRTIFVYAETKRKLNAYHVFVLAGIVSQGLLHYLASCFPRLVWRSFGSWLRTIRPGIAPSELVVSMALRNSFPEFLLVNSHSHNFAKFIAKRQDLDRLDVFRIASG